MMQVSILVLVCAFIGLLSYFYISSRSSASGQGQVRFFTKLSKKHSQKSRRGSDKLKLSGRDLKTYRQALEYVGKGAFEQAASLLESISMQREAITLLEEHGAIDQAARMLMRMGRHNRAGVVYARNQMWSKAAESFRLAHMPVEQAKCYVQQKKYAEAAEPFLAGGRIAEAAECYARSEQHEEAISLFFKLNQLERVLKHIRILSGQTGLDKLGERLSLSHEEKSALASMLASGSTDGELYTLIEDTHLHADIAKTLIEAGKVEQAVILLKRTSQDIGPQLLSELGQTEEVTRVLAQVFKGAGLENYAGMAFERAKEFQHAARAFEHAGEWTRAVHCYERAGESEKAKELQASHVWNEVPESVSGGRRHVSQGITTSPGQQGVEKTAGKFSLSEVTQAEPQARHSAASFAPDQGESTEVMVADFQGSANDFNQFRTMLFELPVFSGLPDSTIETMYSMAEKVRVERGGLILEMGDNPKGCYLLTEGQLDCFRVRKGQLTKVDSLKPPYCIGELWLLKQAPSLVKLEAVKASELFVIEGAAFCDRLSQDATFAQLVYPRLTDRMFELLVRSPRPSVAKTSSAAG